MIRLGDLNEKGVLTIIASGHLSREDLDAVTPRLAQLLDRHGRLRFYVELRDVSGFTMGALWQDLKFDFRHRHQYGRTAIVGHKTWQKVAATFAGPLYGAAVRWFEPEQRDEAWRWVNG